MNHQLSASESSSGLVLLKNKFSSNAGRWTTSWSNWSSGKPPLNQSADVLMRNVLRPTLEAFAGYLDNARLVDSGQTYFMKCELSRRVRFAATAHIAFVVVHDSSIEKPTVQDEAHILPVFIRRAIASNYAATP